MKKFFLYGSGVIILAILGLMILAPKSEIIQRSVIIDEPVGVVYPYFASLQNMEQWSPWLEKDDKTENKYIGSGNNVGSIHIWISDNQQVGKGQQEITSMIENKEIYSEIIFTEPIKTTSTAFFKFDEEENDSTKVTWGYNAHYGALQSVFMMFIDMKELLGADFDKGLLKAKSILEK